MKPETNHKDLEVVEVIELAAEMGPRISVSPCDLPPPSEDPAALDSYTAPESDE